MRFLPFSLIYLLPLCVLIGTRLGGGWTFLPGAIVFGPVPVADLTIGVNRNNPDTKQVAILEKAADLKLVTWLVAPVQLAMVFRGAVMFARGTLTGLEIVGLTFSIGIASGAMGINVSHELIHRHNRPEPFLGMVLLALVPPLWFRVMNPRIPKEIKPLHLVELEPDTV